MKTYADGYADALNDVLRRIDAYEGGKERTPEQTVVFNDIMKVIRTVADDFGASKERENG